MIELTAKQVALISFGAGFFAGVVLTALVILILGHRWARKGQSNG